MRSYAYELIGGHTVLDFLNTVNSWTVESPQERLETFADVLGFGVAAGVLRPVEARALQAMPRPQAAVKQLHDLRAVLASAFQRIAKGKHPTQEILTRISREGASAAAAITLRPAPAGIQRVIDVEDAGIDVVRLRLADAALALLTSTELTRLKSCPECGWFFLDSSKNRSRRWCSMQMCGAPAKSRAYYYRQKRS
jgi:predicted RNA-binding Zn ribbon-like protein